MLPYDVNCFSSLINSELMYNSLSTTYYFLGNTQMSVLPVFVRFD